MDTQGADGNALDFDMTTQPHAPLVDVAAGNMEDSIDLTATQTSNSALDFNLDAMVTNPSGPVAFQPSVDEPMVDLEKTDVGGSLADFDFELGDTRAQNAVASSSALEGLSLDLPAEPAPVSGDDELLGAEETNTKLELARAYEEMGDRDGARELLGEVIKEGTSDQQNRAREMLSKLA